MTRNEKCQFLPMKALALEVNVSKCHISEEMSDVNVM